MSRNSTIWGGILILLGFLLLLNTLRINLFHFVVPVALMVLGAWIVYRKTRTDEPNKKDARYTYNAEQGVYTATVTSAEGTTRASATVHTERPSSDQGNRANEEAKVFGDKVKYSKFLGDMFINCENINIQNVEISIFIGDMEINLAGGKLQSGLNRMIVSGFLGDCLVLIPKDMPVHVHCSGFIGDIELLGKRGSGFGNTMDSQTPEYDAAPSKLYIAVNNFIGDIRVFRV
jgi:predicted membrane protein